MTNILLIAIIAILSLQSVALLFAFRRVRRIYASVIAFITPESEGKPSSLAATVSVMSEVFARSITAQIKTTLMGKSSGIVKQENALAGDMAQDMFSQSPLGALLSSFPTVAKTLRKNPQLIDAAMQLFSKHNSSQSNNGHQAPLSLEIK